MTHIDIKLPIDIEQGKAGLFYVTSPVVRGLLIARQSKSEALDDVQQALDALAEANRVTAAAPDLLEALKAAVRIAEEARQEWDAAPSGMRAGKILVALSGGCPRYRKDIDAIHAAIAKAEGKP